MRKTLDVAGALRAALPRRLRRRTMLAAAVVAALIAGAAAAAPAAFAHGASPAPARGLTPGTRLFVPAPAQGAAQQAATLARSRDFKDAALVTEMESYPQAVWFDSGTPAQVKAQVRKTMAQAAAQRAVPVLVAYDIPGRDCAQYSAGGALTEADYQAWISAFAAGVGGGRAVVIVEPDALGNLPSDCGSPANYPFTDDERYAEVQYAVQALEAKPRVAVYLDGTHSAWQSVGTITTRLLAADVQGAQGFYLNASNYQPTPNLVDYGTWISDCLAMVTSSGFDPDNCASQYYPANPADFSTWDLTTQWYAQNMGTAVASTHFVIDTSRNGDGPNAMTAYTAAPYDQPASVISALAGGNWCNPPASGLGLRPSARTGVPLLDAYLWIKTPGQSDGQCDADGGVRSWDYTAYTQPGWPADATSQGLFDPLWGTDDPAAGAWFPQQALQLAQDASPALKPARR